MSSDEDISNNFSGLTLSQDGGAYPQDCLIGDNGAPVQFEHISVHPPELRGSNRFNTHHVYRITSLPLVADNIYRRYSEFVWLYDTLVSTYPGIFVPPLPPKKMLGSKDESFIETERRPALERFLNRIARIPILSDSMAFQVFMSRTHTFDSAQSEIKKKTQVRTFENLVQTYEYYYRDALSQELPPTIDQEFISLTEFYTEREKYLSEVAISSDELATTVAKQMKLLGKITASVQSITSVETTYPNVPPTQRVAVVDHFAQWVDDLKESESHYIADLFHSYVNELDDARTFIALLNERKNLRSRADKSRAKAMKWDAPGARCSTEKERIARAADFQQDEDDNKLIDMVSKIVYFDQYRNLWNSSVTEYNQHLTAFAESQSSFSQRAYHNWESFAKDE